MCHHPHRFIDGYNVVVLIDDWWVHVSNVKT